MKNKLPISVVICTFNEETNIKDCLLTIKKNNPREIIVVDGGSIDNTAKIARKLKARVVCSQKGLSNQRQRGIEQSKQPHLAFVDADDRLRNTCLETLYKELTENGFDAIQAKTVPLKRGNFWQKAMNFSSQMISSKPRITNMIGRPALYKTDKIRKVGFDGNYFSSGIGCEDTDLAIRFEMMGFVQGIGTGVSERIHADHFGEVWKKIKKYGRGDARVAFKFPEKRNKIIKHQLWNYPVARSINAASRGGLIYVPFFILMGLGRFVFFLPEYIKLKLTYGRYENFK